MNNNDIIAYRKRHLGRNYSTSYDKPFQIVRGKGQYLYDQFGVAYLDGVNNVCHVGHCHPKVVEVAAKQLATLNTNTRYLHTNIVEYTKKLLSTFPSKLDTVFLVCSGSEANDLALRLTRTHTKKRDIICVDHAYHGNLTSLIEISPYKFKGKGGFSTVDTTHVVSAPDIYRGQYNDPDTAGELYANEVKNMIEEHKDNTAAFICESVLGCAGQIPLPKDYLKHVYHHVRRHNVVCIADEVQVGFGRIGSHFWGFESQHVVPDIVTLGKPIGNGMPIAAVVTTREIAESFNNGMEYFNTFGGNPVSCIVGLTVLNVIFEEKLQENALKVGDYLLKGLRTLMEHHELIGDVRGMGLFVGIELVRDRKTKEPAANEATILSNMMRERCILISTDGPHHNVLKLKPPLCFSYSNAHTLVLTLDDCLHELTRIHAKL